MKDFWTPPVMVLGPHGQTAKPATTEPPEGWHAKMPGESVSQWIDGVYPLNTEQLALDRALEDFTARRKAKRNTAALPDPPCRFCGMVANHRKDCDRPREVERWRQVLPCDEPTISRALSTPLPHDPDIHTRLMPWRGK